MSLHPLLRSRSLVLLVDVGFGFTISAVHLRGGFLCLIGAGIILFKYYNVILPSEISSFPCSPGPSLDIKAKDWFDYCGPDDKARCTEWPRSQSTLKKIYSILYC